MRFTQVPLRDGWPTQARLWLESGQFHGWIEFILDLFAFLQPTSDSFPFRIKLVASTLNWLDARTVNNTNAEPNMDSDAHIPALLAAEFNRYCAMLIS